MAELALSHELLMTGQSVKPYLLLSQLEQQHGGNPKTAYEHVKSALDVKEDDPDAWAALGHLHFHKKQFNDAQAAYETVLTLIRQPENVHLIYTRLGALYLRNLGQLNKPVQERSQNDLEFAKKAKTMYIRACEGKSSSQTWLGVGKSCIALGQFNEAEEALSEANILNNKDSDVWAYLALVCLVQDRHFEANQCIAQSIRNKIKDPEILRLVGIAFLNSSQYSPAAECFRFSLQLEPSDMETKNLFTEALSKQSRDYLQPIGGGVDFSEISRDMI